MFWQPQPQHHRQYPAAAKPMYMPRHAGSAHREPRFDPAETTFDVFSDARPYAPRALDVLTSPLTDLIAAGLVDNPSPGAGRHLAREASEGGLPVFGETVRAHGCAHLQVRGVIA